MPDLQHLLVFFPAFVPQFIAPDEHDKAWAFVPLGERAAACMFIGFGLKLALSDNRSR